MTCKDKQENNGVCPHHNLQCGWPKCNEPEQEPVACIHRIVDVTNKVVKSGYMCMDCGAVFRAYTTPPQRKPLTDEQIAEMWLEILGSTPPSGIHEDGLQPWRFARAIEAAHGIKE